MKLFINYWESTIKLSWSALTVHTLAGLHHGSSWYPLAVFPLYLGPAEARGRTGEVLTSPQTTPRPSHRQSLQCPIWHGRGVPKGVSLVGTQACWHDMTFTW